MLPVTIGKPYWRKSIFLQCLQTMYKSDHSQLVRSLVITQTSETASRPQAGVLKRLNLPAWKSKDLLLLSVFKGP